MNYMNYFILKKEVVGGWMIIVLVAVCVIPSLSKKVGDHIEPSRSEVMTAENNTVSMTTQGSTWGYVEKR